ncbi:MAG: efflux RND transporter periplasmic adaptor subunit [Granulosicoccaceae bacterium]
MNNIKTKIRILSVFMVALLGVNNNLALADTESHECLIEPMVVAQVGSQTQGVVDELLVDRGETVKKGQAIARLKSTVEQANLQQAQTRATMKSEINARHADLKLATQTLNRMKSLHAKNLAPAQHKDEAEAQLRVATAALTQAQENYELLQLDLTRAVNLLDQRTIVSPIDGVVVELQTFPGEFIYENPVMTIAQLHPLRVEVFLPGRLFNQYVKGDKAKVQAELDDGQLTAVVDVVDPLLDTSSGTYGVRLLLPNSDRTITSGQKCQLEFSSTVASAEQ